MFVDIGFEKNAFLHFWDALPAALDSGIEEVDRPSGKNKDRKRITAKDIPNIYPVGSEVLVQVTKGPISTKGPRITTNLSLPGRYLVLMPYSDQSGISRKIESPKERERLRKILKELDVPEGMGVIVRTVGEGQRARYFVAILVSSWSNGARLSRR
jgi:ribonuclease G